LSVKIRPTVSPAGEGKNQEKKSSKHANVLGCQSINQSINQSIKRGCLSSRATSRL